MTPTQFGEILREWLLLLGPLAAGVALIIVLAGILSGSRQRGAERQRIWRVALIAVSLFVFVESTGVARWIVAQTWPRLTQSVAGPNVLAATSPDSIPLFVRVPDLSFWPAAIWLSGAALVFGRLLWVHVRLHRLGSQLHPVTCPAMLDTIQSLSARIGVTAPPAVFCHRLLSPVVVGCRRPRIVLPDDFADNFDAECQAAVLAHELGHVAAGDARWQMLVETLAAVLWWHPGIWWARRQVARAAEQAADETTLYLYDGPCLLAKSLVAIGWQLVGRPLRGSLAASGLRSELAKRVEQLLRLDRSAMPLRLKSVGMVGCIAALGLSVLVSVGSGWAWAANGGNALMSRVWMSASRAWGDGPAGNAPVSRPPPTHPEFAAIATLHLTAEQEERFWELHAQLEIATAEMHRLSSGKIARGLDINREWIRGLKSIFTEEQFAGYCLYWESQTPRRMLLRRIS